MKIRKQSIQQAQQAARDHLIKSITIKCCFYAMLLVLNGLEGYGKKKDFSACLMSSQRP